MFNNNGRNDNNSSNDKLCHFLNFKFLAKMNDQCHVRTMSNSTFLKINICSTLTRVVLYLMGGPDLISKPYFARLDLLLGSGL